MQTPGLNHIVMTISDTERSRAFYGDLLGFEITVMHEAPDKSFSSAVAAYSSFSFHHASQLRTTASANFGSAWTIHPSLRRTWNSCRK